MPTTLMKDCIVLYNIYDTLMRMESDGSITPRLATSFTVSGDGLEYTVKLRDDVYFHNGYKMTSADVEFTFKTLEELYPSDFSIAFNNLVRVEAIDEYTVKFILSSPYVNFDSCFSGRTGTIVSKQYFEEVGGSEGYNLAPIGTGAYIFQSRVSGESVTLVANEDYWNGAPQIKTIIIKPIANVSTQFLSLENGEVDVIVGADAASCQQIVSPNLKWDYISSSNRSIIQFVARPPSPCADKNLRKAIQCAINKDEVLLGAVEGYGVILDYDSVPIWRGAPDPAAINLVPHDINKAKEYLAASSYKGETLIIMAISGTVQEKAAQIIQGQLLAIGIDLQIMSVDASTRLTLARTGDGIDMQSYLYGSPKNDISGYSFPYALNVNYAPFVDQAFWEETDRLTTASLVALDPAVSRRHVADLVNLIQEEATLIPLFSPANFAAWNADLSGVAPHPVGIMYYIEDWSW